MSWRKKSQTTPVSLPNPPKTGHEESDKTEPIEQQRGYFSHGEYPISMKSQVLSTGRKKILLLSVLDAQRRGYQVWRLK